MRVVATYGLLLESIWITHDFSSQDERKNLIVMREPHTMPYIKNVSVPQIAYIDTSLNTYSILIEEEQEKYAQLIIEDDQCWHM